MFKYNVKSIIIIFFVIILYSCVSNKTNENVIFKINNFETENNSEIILFNNDYNIIDYIENKIINIEIINLEKREQLINQINPNNITNLVFYNPIINIKIFGKEYLAKGMWILSSVIPEDCDFIFDLDANGKIWILENNNIIFKKWKE